MTPAQERRGKPAVEDCLAVRIPQAAQLLGIGRSSLYELISSGQLETIKIGRSTVVPMDALRAFIQQRRVAK
ncbi:MAG: excisionase family binding protein [Bradyrhizobium sp.]|nr:excisionase family binding protein [Bradyrhizobium sp.]